jgi:transcriptional regulator with XRE-family HTH domain
VPAHDLIDLPAMFWTRPQVCDALRARDLGHLFRLLRQYHQITQTQIGIATAMKQSRVSEFMKGKHQAESIVLLERVAEGLDMPDLSRMHFGLAPRVPSQASALGTGTISAVDSSDTGSGLLSWDRVLDGADEGADNAMRRRDLLALAGASTVAGTLASAANTASSFLTELLIPFPLTPSALTERAVPPYQLLRLSVRVRNQYQACRYDAAAGTLAELAPALQAAVTVSNGDLKSRLQSAISDAYHVIAGILLKVGNEGLAAVAADRSMNAARESENPVTLGASARIVSHALMGSGGHARRVRTSNDSPKVSRHI